MTHDPYSCFRGGAYFPQLDGLRAISILLVLIVHMRDSLWDGVHGYLGVTLFFIVSGFLITTLLLREEDDNQHVSLRAFYIRRTFRIFPLYFLALAVFTMLVWAGFADHSGDYNSRLQFFLVYLNELVSGGTFGHSWSLGVEEKYYLAWPLLAFAIPIGQRCRILIAALLLTACLAAASLGPKAYLGQYVPIVAGVLLALTLHNPRGFAVAQQLARPRWATPCLIAAIIGFSLDGPPDDHIAVVFALTATLTFPLVLLGPHWAHGWLQSRPLRFIGQRSYAIYLFHPLVLSVVDRVLPGRGAPVVIELMRLAVTVAVSLMVADVLHRTIEGPLIRAGRALATRSNHTNTTTGGGTRPGIRAARPKKPTTPATRPPSQS